MVILSLMFLVFVGMNIKSSAVRVKRVDAYMEDMQKELLEELKIIN